MKQKFPCRPWKLKWRKYLPVAHRRPQTETGRYARKEAEAGKKFDEKGAEPQHPFSISPLSLQHWKQSGGGREVENEVAKLNLG